MRHTYEYLREEMSRAQKRLTRMRVLLSARGRPADAALLSNFERAYELMQRTLGQVDGTPRGAVDALPKVYAGVAQETGSHTSEDDAQQAALVFREEERVLRGFAYSETGVLRLEMLALAKKCSDLARALSQR